MKEIYSSTKLILNHKAEIWIELVENIFYMLLVVHYLYHHLDRYPEKLSDFSKVWATRFNQDVKTVEEDSIAVW